MQIRSKLTLQFATLVIGILLIAFFTVYFFSKQSSENTFYKRLNEKAITSAILLLKVEQVDSTLLKTIDLSKQDVLYRENISIFDDFGKEIYTNNDTIQFDISTSQFSKIKQLGEQRFSQGDFDIIGIPFRYHEHLYIVLAGAVDAQGRNQLGQLKKILIILFTALVAIVTLAGWVYAGRALKPIKKVIEDIQNISTVDLSARLNEMPNQDEIGNLVSIFNGLLSRIENSFAMQKTFLTNVSHELKNPLTKITSQLEVTLLNQRPSEVYQETIRSVLEDIKELNQLSNSLLDLAYLEQNNKNLTTTRIRIDEVLWEVRDTILSQNSSYKIDIHTIEMPENDEDLYLKGNLYLLKTALQNLIENACKFSPIKMATVSLLCSLGELEIRIFDNGPGIAKEDLSNIFQPFFRTDNTSKIKGHGIGLSLCQKIITIHKGTIEVESMLGQGTQMTVFFKTNR